MPKVFEINFSPKQMHALRTIESDDCEELLEGGAKGSGKTVFACHYVYFKIKQLIQFFGLQPSSHPPVLMFFGRKQGVDFSTTTLNTWKRDIPADAYEIKEQKKLIVIEKTAAIQFGGLDDTDTIQKFNSAEYCVIVIDQAEELTEKDAGMLRATLRLKINGKEPKYKMLWTCNPVISDDEDFKWLKRDFIEAPKKGYRFIKALYTDNPFLPDNYGDTLDKAYGFNPQILAAYKNGEWGGLSVTNNVIKGDWVKMCINKPIFTPPNDIKRVISIDVARFGDDATVFKAIENNREVATEEHRKKDNMEVVAEALLFAERHLKTDNFAVDELNTGSGVADRLKELGKKVIFINASKSSHDPERFFNRRAEMYCYASGLFYNGNVSILEGDYKLIDQLPWARFKELKSNGKFQLEGKDDIKKRNNGVSPDHADAFVQGLWALQFVEGISDSKFLKQPNNFWVHPRFSNHQVGGLQ